MKRTAAFLLVCILVISCLSIASGESFASAYAVYQSNGAYPALSQRYEGSFLVGVSLIGNEISGPPANAVVSCFNLLSCVSMMEGNYLLARNATKKLNDPNRVALYFDQTDKILSFAQEHGMRVRAHALISHKQMPKWFFTENWAQGSSAKLVDRDTLIARMENYIRDEMTYINTAYPGLVCAWDVVDEAIDPSQGDPLMLRVKDNLWYRIIGSDYIELAFQFAKKYAAADQQLLLCDSDCFTKDKSDAMIHWLQRLKALNLVDGVGLHGHLGMDEPSVNEYKQVIQSFSDIGLSIHITELDVKTSDPSALGQMQLAARYKTLLQMLESLRNDLHIPIESVTFANLTDSQSALNNSREQAYPLLFDDDLKPKLSYFGALQDPMVPDSHDEGACIEALKALDLYEEPPEEKVMVFKTLNQHNPVMVQHFGADPWAMEYQDRIYLYMTGDEPMYDHNGVIQTNTYGNITTLRVISSDDLVNWQDHGDIPVAGRQGAAAWASNSWAPSAAWKNIDGKDRFFLYFANSAGGIGVLTADSPTGPFTDPLGKPLISRSTPSCDTVTWLFDPAVFMDDDGNAYLYFGGGIPDGKASAPGTARAVKLGEDMISLDGDPVRIDAPWLFEDSGINKFGNTYVYSYCSNFQVPSSGSSQGFYSGEIVYMISDYPLGPFVYGGRVLKNPGSYFGVGGNNHHCMFKFKGQWYITYHAATIDHQMGWNAGYRSTFIDVLRLNDKGLPDLSEGTYTGVKQLRAFDPYRSVPAAAAASMAGVGIRQKRENLYAESTVSGSWIGVSQADFTDQGAVNLSLRWMAENDTVVTILLDDFQAEPCAQFTLKKAEEWQDAVFWLSEEITGVHDLYLCFSKPDFMLAQWQFGR
ncbi:MAG: endo-1,4-beta-xylanase [Clostridia bacterium]|nr:endo-1,4-beta-xylanase [Clostridia bacterium]